MAKNNATDIQVDVETKTAVVTIGGTTVAIDLEKGVVVTTDETMGVTSKGAPGVTFGDDVVIRTNGAVKVESATPAPAQPEAKPEEAKPAPEPTPEPAPAPVAVDPAIAAAAKAEAEADAKAALDAAAAQEEAAQKPAVKEEEQKPQPTVTRLQQVGTRRGADGSIYAGRIPGTDTLVYVMPQDAQDVSGKPLKMTFNEASDYVGTLNATSTLGHDDWQLPSRAALHTVQQNQSTGRLDGTLNTTGNEFAGWYWTAEKEFGQEIWAERLSDGYQASLRKGSGHELAVRAVRYETAKPLTPPAPV